MTLYVGETTRVRSTGKDFDGTALTNVNVLTAKVTVTRKTDSVVILNGVALVWDSTHSFWYYDWDTTGQSAGAYRAKVEFTGNNFKTWEYVDIRLKTNP